MHSFEDTAKERWLQESGLIELLSASKNILNRLEGRLALGEKLDVKPFRDAIAKVDDKTQED